MKRTDVIKFTRATERAINRLMKKVGSSEGWGAIDDVKMNVIEDDILITFEGRVGLTAKANYANFKFNVLGFGDESIKSLSGKVAYAIVQNIIEHDGDDGGDENNCN